MMRKYITGDILCSGDDWVWLGGNEVVGKCKLRAVWETEEAL